MTRLPALLILALASGALADNPPPPPALTWAEWVGDWSGKLKWSSCAAEGEDKATIGVDATDGAVTIDLAPAGSALTSLSLVEDNGGWSGRSGDVSVRLAKSRTADLELAIDLDSGCAIRGTLARPSVGIPACDRLVAWARVESQCTRLSRPPLENAARVARQKAEWTKARGAARLKIAAQCVVRSEKLQTALVDAGCAPHPDPAIGLRAAECQALRSTASRFARCAAIPFDLREGIEREVVVLHAASQGADRASLPVVDGECRRTREKLFVIAQQHGCPP